MATDTKASKDLDIIKDEEPEEEQVTCTVLFGYGRVAPTYRNYVDGYQFVGGVGRDIPKAIADNWKKGLRADGKPAIHGRIKLQAILASEATESDFVKATGIVLMAPDKVAAMVSGTDAALLVKSLGRKRAIELAEELLKNSGQS